MKPYFEGYYYKHQKGENTLCFIVGKSVSEEFIQIITNKSSYTIPFIGNNSFSGRGVKIDIENDTLKISGEIFYGELTPVKYDIMGIFRYFPMECRHGIISMYHTLHGSILLNNELLDFNGGVGYIEKDSGVSFPKSYVWMQCNDFAQKCSAVISIAHIPFFGVSFRGCICAVYYKNKEYRFATYLGTKILCFTQNKIILQQRKMKIEIDIQPGKGFYLNAPDRGVMERTIIESPSCPVKIKLYDQGEVILDLYSEHASFEYEYGH